MSTSTDPQSPNELSTSASELGPNLPTDFYANEEESTALLNLAWLKRAIDAMRKQVRIDGVDSARDLFGLTSTIDAG